LIDAVPQERSLPFDDGGWAVSGPAIRQERGERGQELVAETGIAYRRDVSMIDGTIDFDVQLTSRRSFVYVSFRMQDENEFEEFYLRPHKSGLPDAIQYAPVYQRHSAWQLYHGPGATAAIDLPAQRWVPVRVVMSGQRAALFIDNLTTPAMVVPQLAREPRAGFIAVRGFVPAGTPGTDPAARFANVRIRPGHVPFTFPPAPAAATEAGLVIRQWAVSRAVTRAAWPGGRLPSAAQAGPLTVLDARPDGLLELHRFVRLPEGSRDAAALASVTVRSPEARTVALDLGFSDEVTVFVNGQPLFHRNDAYSFDNPRREGLVGFDQARLYLPLKAGDNTLSVVVGDAFGGWALMGRLRDATGLTTSAK
jgi:hypothetical protein